MCQLLPSHIFHETEVHEFETVPVYERWCSSFRHSVQARIKFRPFALNVAFRVIFLSCGISER